MSNCRTFLCAVLFLILSAPVVRAETEDHSRLPDTPIPIDRSVPTPPAPILELGNSFLNTGPIDPGFQIPTGAVWQPSLVVWGTYRTAVQTSETEKGRTTEWANRFDLFSNLYLTQSERILLGMRPLDKDGHFTSYTFDSPNPDTDEAFEEELNAKLTTGFFEGDFGELFPGLDPYDQYGLDVAIAAGRQPIAFQEGMLVNDTIDSLGLSKINLKSPGVVNHRASFVWGWNELNRNNLPQDDESAALFGIFNEVDIPSSTIEVDAIYVDSDDTGDGWHAGLGATQRLGAYNTTFRALLSRASGDETAASDDGAILFGEASHTLAASNDVVYLNGFWAIDHFRSASRAPNAGGPLAPVGVLFESVGIGSYGAPLSSSADEAFGGVCGYQLFSADTRFQVIFELGTRISTSETGQRAGAGAVSLQRAFGQRTVIRADFYSLYGDPRPGDKASDEELDVGGRIEWMLRL